MKKRIVAAMLLSSMLVGCLTACGGSTPANESSSKPASSSSGSSASTSSSTSGSTETAGSDETAEPEEKTYDEQITISYATIQVRDGVDYNNEEYTKWWTDKFNIQWDIVSLSFDNWAEKLRIWINSGDMPDLCTWNYVHSEAISFADQELIRKFPEGWKETWPNLAAAYEATGVVSMMEEQLGGTYILPRPIYFDN